MSFSDAFDSAGNNTGNRKPGSGLAGFDSVAAAEEYKPLPAGIYTARIVSGTFTQTKAGADAYKIAFEIDEGEHRRRRLFRIWTFSEKAIAYTKRDLAAFGLTTSQALLAAYPPMGREYFVRLTVALQRGDDGREFNDVKRIDVLRSEESPAAKFLIDPATPEGGTP